MLHEAKREVLDHGYVQLVESWGSEERIIESARMSTNKGFKGWDTDGKLLAYMWRNRHSTPFEFCGLTIEVKAPIFVFRQWHRHRTFSYNEMSARFTPLPDETYVPDARNVLARSNVETENKQASRAVQRAPWEHEVDHWLGDLRSAYEIVQAVYDRGLEIGIPKELARCCLPVARYSRMRATGNLRNWLHFLCLRLDEHAQWEIREYARVIGTIIESLFPRTWSLFLDGRKND